MRKLAAGYLGRFKILFWAYAKGRGAKSVTRSTIRSYMIHGLLKPKRTKAPLSYVCLATSAHLGVRNVYKHRKITKFTRNTSIK